jgi:O-antigen/teichoic acid export membrane protein
MFKKNKIYWLEGVTKKGVEALLNDENAKYRWLRPQRNRRVLVILMALGLVLTSMGSYWPTLKTNLNLSGEVAVTIYSVTAVFVVLALIGGYSFLRIAVRSIADAPDELLDERQIAVRNTSYRYAYFILCYILMGLMVMVFFGPDLQMFQPEGNDGSYVYVAVAIFFACAALPSMVMAWRERDI